MTHLIRGQWSVSYNLIITYSFCLLLVLPSQFSLPTEITSFYPLAHVMTAIYTTVRFQYSHQWSTFMLGLEWKKNKLTCQENCNWVQYNFLVLDGHLDSMLEYSYQRRFLLICSSNEFWRKKLFISVSENTLQTSLILSSCRVHYNPKV